MQLPKYKYEVEFTQKFGKKWAISQSLLDDYVARMRALSKNFVPHTNLYGTTNNGMVRFVHFYSDVPFGYVHSATKDYAGEKRFGFTVKMKERKEPPAPSLAKGGIIDSIWSFLNTPI